MGRVKMDDARYNQIRKKIEAGLSVVKISQLEKCSQRTVRLIRDGKMLMPSRERSSTATPVWSLSLDWDEVHKDVTKRRHALSDIWEESKLEISYSQFTRYFHQRFPLLNLKTSTHRVFESGERVEVDYSGKRPEWIDIRTGEIFESEIFVSALGESQKIFACTSVSQKSEDFIESHNRMFSFYGGVPRIIVPDNLKSGVTQSDLYDPKINVAYEDMANHYNTVVIPARVYKPKDKSLVEGAVKLVSRYLRFWYRRETFTSPSEIDEALLKICEKINNKPHTRFRISREEKFLESEQKSLKPLPKNLYEFAKFKEARVYCDSHISVDHNFYSVPHVLRGKKVRVRLTSQQVEIFKDLEKVATHKRLSPNKGRYVTEIYHLPEASKAYYERTPQNILSQAKFINNKLSEFLSELFQSKGALENLRRAEGIVKVAQKEIELLNDQNRSSKNIHKAIEQMKEFNHFTTHYFRESLKVLRVDKSHCKGTIINRSSENLILRHTNNNPITKGVNHGISTNKKCNDGVKATRHVPEIGPSA